MKTVKLILLILFISISGCTSQTDKHESNGWEAVDLILKNIKAPVFPDKEFNVLDFGAVNDGTKDCFAAFKKSIEKCNSEGGGKIIVPKGTYMCNGPIHLKSNVNFHLEEGAVVKFGTNPDDYLPVVHTRWESSECFNYSSLIYAFEQENIAVTGKGIFDGQANDLNWWAWKGGSPGQKDDNARPLLMKMNNDNVPVERRVFGKDHYLRPNFIQPYKCKNVLIEGVTFIDSPMWFVNPVLSENIIVRGITTKSNGPNTDGCDPESCKNMLIENCSFSNGDDCIALKSGRNNDGRKINIPCENIIIRNCDMKDGHGGVVIGSEISGGARNIFAENCTMDSPNLDRAVRIKTNIHRGGTIENIFVRNITVGEVGEAVLKINMKYDPKETGEGEFLPVVRNVHLENVVSKKSKYGLYLDGLDASKIDNVVIDGCKFDGVANGNILNGVEHIITKDFYINGEVQSFE